METISADVVTQQLLAVLDEAIEHPPKPWTYFTDHGPEAGLLGTLARLSPADAFQITGGRSVAAHVRHVTFGMGAAAAWIRGDRGRHNWEESWRVSGVDEASWARLQEELRAAYRDLRAAIAAHAAAGPEAFGGAVGAVAHLAYHLGAIRQKLPGRQP